MDAVSAALRRLARASAGLVRHCASAIARRHLQARHARLIATMNDRDLRDIGLFRTGERIGAERCSDGWPYSGSPLPPAGDGGAPERRNEPNGASPVPDGMNLDGHSHADIAD